MVTDGIVTIFGIALMVMFFSVGIYVLLFILGGAAAMLEMDGLYNLIGDFLFWWMGKFLAGCFGGICLFFILTALLNHKKKIDF